MADRRLRVAALGSACIAVSCATGRVPVMLWSGPPESQNVDVQEASAAARQAAFWAGRQRCVARTGTRWLRETASWKVTDWSGCDASSQVRLVELPKALEAWPGDGIPVAWEFLRGFDSGIRGQGSVIETNAASYVRRHASPGALASLFGADIAPTTAFAEGPSLPAILAGVRVEVRDRTGNTGNAGMIFVSPGQINLQIPEGLQAGMASVFVYQGQILTHKDWLYIDASAPGLSRTPLPVVGRRPAKCFMCMRTALGWQRRWRADGNDRTVRFNIAPPRCIWVKPQPRFT